MTTPTETLTIRRRTACHSTHAEDNTVVFNTQQCLGTHREPDTLDRRGYQSVPFKWLIGEPYHPPGLA